jgi:hypothetical protein
MTVKVAGGPWRLRTPRLQKKTTDDSGRLYLGVGVRPHNYGASDFGQGDFYRR